MPFVDTMRIVTAEYSAVILCKHVGQKESEIVFHNLVFRVNPILFPKNADPSSAPKPSCIIGLLSEFCIPSRASILYQVMLS
jgi:hypothetical protein